MPKKVDRKVELSKFFEQGFEQKDWLNVGDMKLPVELKFLGVDDFESRFGVTKRYTFQNAEGRECRLLCKGNTFYKAVEQFVVSGNTLLLNKDERNYWVIEDIK